MELPREPYSFRLNVGDPETLLIVQGDITKAWPSRAIVNAANSELEIGGGVDHAIHAAAGPIVYEECQAIKKRMGPLHPGKAIATSAGRLDAECIIHTVGPIWRGGTSGESEVLASCYRESFRIAEERKIADISFPAISTGAFGYPAEEAAWVAVPTVVDCLRRSKRVCMAVLILYDRDTQDVFSRVAMAQKHPGSGMPYEVIIGYGSQKADRS